MKEQIQQQAHIQLTLELSMEKGLKSFYRGIKD